MQEHRFDFVTDILIRYKNLKQIYGYKLENYWSNIASVESYYQTNMDFLKPEIRNYFFHQEPYIYSKVDDLAPAKYNTGAEVRNSPDGKRMYYQWNSRELRTVQTGICRQELRN